MAGYVNQEHYGSFGFQLQHTEKDKNREGWRAYVQNEGKAIIDHHFLYLKLVFF